MNFNDKNHSDPAFVLRTQEDDIFQHEILKSSDSQNVIQIKPKSHMNPISKVPFIRGKQNDVNSAQGLNKNLITNHSFNGYFNEISQKPGKKITESISKRVQHFDIANNKNQVNSPTNFNSTGKLSNLQFVGDSSKTYGIPDSMHLEVKSFVEEYFPDNFQTGNFYGKYFSIQNFVEILFQQFYDLIGGQNGYDLVEEFGQKLFIVFGDKIYFQELFEKTLENGLTGLIFQIVKSINEDRRQNRDFKQIRTVLKPTQAIQPKSSFANKGLLQSGFGGVKSQKKSQMINFVGEGISNSSVCRGQVEKVSLEKFFGNSISKVKFYDRFSSQEGTSQMNEENIEQVKLILEEYIESMYEEAESKLNKRYAQEMKKMTIKFKEAEKLLQKVNQRISHHYDSIQLEKEHEKKIKQHQQKQVELENRIKKLEYELKSSKDDAQKEKLNCFKLEQESTKLKEKLEKYENAIFEKAMERDSSQSTNGSNIMKETKTNSSIYSQNQTLYQEPVLQENPSRFEFKIDTFTEHRPIQIPVANTQQQSTYVPYASRHLGNGGLTPTRIRELERTPSVSPLKQRISFVKTQNPVVNSRITINGNDSKPVQSANQNSRVEYSTNKTSGGRGVQNEGSKMKVSSVVEIGEKVQLRPLSPIGKLGEQSGANGSSYNGTNQGVTGQMSQNVYGQRTYSPIKVQFCTSRVSTVSTVNK